MKFKNLLLFVSFIAIFSCNIEPIGENPDEIIQEEEETEETTDLILVKKIVYNKDTNDEYTDFFNYDGNKLLSVDYGDGYRNVYTYENDYLVKDEYFEENMLSASITLEYNTDGTLATFTETFFEASGLDDRQYKHDFTYNTDGTITSKVYGNYDNAGFELDWTDTITFNGKNIAEISDDEGFSITSTFDDKNGAFKNIHAIEVLNILSENEFGALIYGNTNNMLSYIENGTGSYYYNDSYEYTYDEKNYPKTCIFRSVYGNEEEEVETIEYFYE